MNRVMISFLFLMMIQLSVLAQNTNKVLELPEFKSIYVNSGYTVYLKQTNKQEVRVEAPTDIFSLSEFKVENGVLMINLERKPEAQSKSIWAKIDDIKLNPQMKVYISVKSIGEIRVNGTGKVISENSIASDNLFLGVAGAGSIDLDIKGNSITTEITGSGNITLKGYASTNTVHLYGSGNLNSFALELEKAVVLASGSGTGELNVTTTLDVQVFGNSSIKHKGNTKNLTKKIYGAGTVDRAY